MNSDEFSGRMNRFVIIQFVFRWELGKREGGDRLRNSPVHAHRGASINGMARSSDTRASGRSCARQVKCEQAGKRAS